MAWKVKVYINGAMEENTKELTNKIKKMDTEDTNGQMEEFMKDIGKKANSMERENTFLKIR